MIDRRVGVPSYFIPTIKYSIADMYLRGVVSEVLGDIKQSACSLFSCATKMLTLIQLDCVLHQSDATPVETLRAQRHALFVFSVLLVSEALSTRLRMIWWALSTVKNHAVDFAIDRIEPEESPAPLSVLRPILDFG